METNELREIAKNNVNLFENMIDDSQYKRTCKTLMRAEIIILLLTVVGLFVGPKWINTLSGVVITIQMIYFIIFGYFAGYREYLKVIIKSLI